MIETSSDRRPLKTRHQRWAAGLTRLLLKTPVTPDQISLLGIGAAAAAGACLAALRPSGGWLLAAAAAAFIQLRLLCNMMDGMVAVEGQRRSRFGELFNEWPDRFEDIVILVGAGAAAGHIALGWAAATVAVLTAYVRAFGVSVGAGACFCGPMAKPQRMFALTVACGLEAAFAARGAALSWALAIVVAGGIVTLVRRGRFVAVYLEKRRP